MKYYQIIHKGETVGKIEISEIYGAEFLAVLKGIPNVSLVPLKAPETKPAAGGIGAAMVRAMISSYERQNQY